ncbi:hypothetical protein M9979_10995 [Sphingomonas sp. RP10(2022)]|uniref:Uncharacterized protein n=1 Tax=Sphingomonas liriopis TaxID=2949094 RepID=A0A9X2HYZ3_9SPHN|nr:hypothetical protein [Sphingomonas liriopis]MCP3735395.1 hypothetical protein [Sphingomonas liriopis]
MSYPLRPAPSPVLPMAALAAAALLAGLLPGGRWSDMLALLASVAALCAAHERRTRDMLIAAGLSVGLAPVGLLLAPLCAGLAIRQRGARHMPVAVLAAALVAFALPWSAPLATLPNLATLAGTWPASLGLIVAFGAGIAAWIGARASILPPGALFAEARLATLMLAAFVPLPVGAIGFIVMIVALPLPAAPCLRAANDNAAYRRIVGLAA